MWLLASVSLAGCSTHMPSVAPHERPTGKEAIVYGRFEVSGSPPFSADVPHSSMALVMRCEDSREYRMRFDDVQPIVVLAAAPSTCWLDELLYLDSSNTTLGRATLPDRVRRAMRLDAGLAYYLGDFSGSITFEVTDGFRERFQVNDWRNELTTTTQHFRARFPKLRHLEPVDPLTSATKPSTAGVDPAGSI
jgi:hypothetical protein